MLKNPSSIYTNRNKTIVLLVIFFMVFVSFRETKTTTLVIKNTTIRSRKNEVIVVNRNSLGNTGNHAFPQVQRGQDILVSQTIDKNQDGNWDELLIEVSLAPRSTDTLSVSWVDSIHQQLFKQFTNVRLSLRSDVETPSPEINQALHYRGFTQNIAKPFYQMEGPAIENDKVAFRAFFDARNGKDIYGKIVDTPVLEKVGIGASWHTLQPWGMDILKVGNSLGAGALAVAEEKKITPLGDADITRFCALYEGALQAAFKLNFTGWNIGKTHGNGSEEVSLTKGNYYYKNETSVPLNSSQQLIAGMANFGMDHVVYKKHNERYTSISTYGKQAEGSASNLGLAILFSTKDYKENATADTLSTIPNTSYVVLKPGNKKVIYFFACWEKTNSSFSTQKGFADYLDQTASLLAHPIQIKIISK